MDASSIPNSDPPEEPPSTGPASSRYDIELAGAELLEADEEPLLLEAARITLLAEHVHGADISIAVVDNDTIHELNRRYLQHDYATDVLSFLLEAQFSSDCSEPSANSPEDLRGAGLVLSGEIILSAEMARQQAAEFHWRGRDELVLYLVHGLLHLCGYDDLTASERTLMRRREQAILSTWNLAPHYADAAPDARDGQSTTRRTGATQ